MTLRADDLWFGYSAKRAVLRGLSVSLGPGRTVLLGPNGAGKSTLLKVLSGLLKPSRGQVLLEDEGVSGMRLRRRVSFMPQEIAPLAGLTVLESVQYAAWLNGSSRRQALGSATEAVHAVGLWDKRNERSTRLSGGQLRRMGLASALTSGPEVLLLDEPTAGLDPAQRLRFREVLTALPDHLVVVVSTHQMDDVEDCYDQVLILSDGTLRWDGTPSALLAMAGGSSTRQAEQAYLHLVGDD